MAVRSCGVEGCGAEFETRGAGRYCPAHRRPVSDRVRAARSASAKRTKERHSERYNAAQNDRRAANREAVNDASRKDYQANAEARRNRFIMRKYGYSTPEEAQRHRDAYHARHRQDADQLSRERFELGY